MKDSRISKNMIYFLAVSFAVLFLTSLIQTSFLPAVALFGAIPDLVLILVCGVAFYLGPVDGALFGLVGGILTDGLGGVGFSFSPILYTVIGVLLGLLAMAAFANKFIHWIIYSAIFCLTKALYSIFRILLDSGEVRLGAALGSSVLPELFGTLLLSVALYVPAKWVAGLLRGRMSMKKGKGGIGDL